MTTYTKSARRQTFLLDRSKRRASRFSAVNPKVASSIAAARGLGARTTPESLWISYERKLTEAALRNLSWPGRSLGSAILMHAIDARTIPILASRFTHFAIAPREGFLPPEELSEVLEAGNRAELFLGGIVDDASQTITLWRGNLEALTVPMSAFEESGDGIRPDFERFTVIDSGQTIRLGNYEAASDAILYEFDPVYRRRVSKERRETEQSFGAALRRLRKQRGVHREDFAPDIAAKTIARIEQGKVQKIQQRTLRAIARRLNVAPGEIETY